MYFIMLVGEFYGLPKYSRVYSHKLHSVDDYDFLLFHLITSSGSRCGYIFVQNQLHMIAKFSCGIEEAYSSYSAIVFEIFF